jgi:hypothetical protein
MQTEAPRNFLKNMVVGNLKKLLAMLFNKKEENKSSPLRSGESADKESESGENTDFDEDLGLLDN